mgnify:CR=1 FL=1
MAVFEKFMFRFISLDPVEIARNLIGCLLCRYINGETLSFEITEVEVYLGPEDLASHARFGKTKRNAVMFGPKDFWYVYLCYGIHTMLNLTTGSEGKPSAILIRSVNGANGPGRLTKRLGIDLSFNGLPCSQSSNLWIEQGIIRDSIVTPRIGVDYAGPIWSQKLYRFIKK